MSVFTNYRIDIDCLITWFPVRHGAALTVPQIRMDTFSQHADDPPFTIGNKIGRFIALDASLGQDGLDSKGFVRAFTTTGVDANEVFSMELEVGLGRRFRTQQLRLEPNTITPFLMNIRAAPGEDQELADTAATFQGVVTAGPRRSQLLYQVALVVSRVIGLFFPVTRSGGARFDSPDQPTLGTGAGKPSSTVDGNQVE
jgi:hypothetical protein